MGEYVDLQKVNHVYECEWIILQHFGKIDEFGTQKRLRDGENSVKELLTS